MDELSSSLFAVSECVAALYDVRLQALQPTNQCMAEILLMCQLSRQTGSLDAKECIKQRQGVTSNDLIFFHEARNAIGLTALDK